MEEKGADEDSDGNSVSVDGISVKVLGVGVETTDAVDVDVSQVDSVDAYVWEVCAGEIGPSLLYVREDD